MKTNITNKINFRDHDDCILTYGHFNSIHPGHIRYLKNAKKEGENMIVALIGKNTKSSYKFSFSQKERAESLALLNIANTIFKLKDDILLDFLKKLNPRLLILGEEYKNTKDKDILDCVAYQRSKQRSVKFHAGEINYASSDLLENSEEVLKEDRKKSLLNAIKRQKINKNDLLECINEWKNVHLLILGDVIVDQYSACEGIGMSAEAPVVVVKEKEKRNFIGGAAVVASHIKSLGAQCSLISVIGDDESGQYLIKEVEKNGINNNMIIDSKRPTTFKKRYVVENQKLFRVSRLEDKDISQNIEELIFKKLESIAPSLDGIVISDFGYGIITDKVLKKIHNLTKKFNLLLFGDVQCSSQIGMITKLKNFDLLCPNEREVRIALQDKNCGLEKLSHKLIEKTNTKQLIMKLGADGFITYKRDKNNDLTNQSFPALTANPIDVAGAGDSLLSVFAIGLSSKQDIMKTSAIACCMASIAVERMGNNSISKSDLINKIEDIFN